MSDGIKYEIAEVQSNFWLGDLADRIAPLSGSHASDFRRQAEQKERRPPSDFNKIAGELRQFLHIIGTGQPVRGPVPEDRPSCSNTAKRKRSESPTVPTHPA